MASLDLALAVTLGWLCASSNTRACGELHEPYVCVFVGHSVYAIM